MGLSTNLTTHWSLEEASGSRADDTASAQTLTDNATVTQNPGKIGNAAQFTKANLEYLSHTDNATLSTGDINFAIACWCYLDSVSADTGLSLMTKYLTTGNQREYLLFYNETDHGPPNNRFSWIVSNNGTATTTLDAATFGAASTATWYFVAAYHDATNNVLGIGVNDTWDTVSYSSGVFDSTAEFHLGSINTNTYPMNGRIDQAAFWKNYVPSAAEWTWLYNSGNGRSYSEIAAYEAAGQPTMARWKGSIWPTGARRIGRRW